jgi:nitroreductase
LLVRTCSSAGLSLRRLLAGPVPTAPLGSLLHAARRAPSGANLQSGRFFPVEGAARPRLIAALLAA